MCGIAGLLGDGVDEHDVGPMLALQRHRGPDAEGIWSDRHCVLGHCRLAIIDLSEAGRQPLANEDGSVWVTFNGEIYNFQTLRTELEGLGHVFRTGTDTEAIVHAYEQWGTACVSRFRGMFAFALWDQPRRRLFLARDRVGKKPLFYTRAGGRFLFASELQGLLAGPDVPRDAYLPAIDAYLALGYVPGPETAFRGIFKLPPASWMTVDLTSGGPEVRVEEYWSLRYVPKLQIGEAEAAEALRDKLREAVRLRMISDVPLGAFLSGGIDSSVVVGLMAALADRPVKTFSIGFEDAVFNELPHARRIADRWGTEHHEHVVRADAAAILPDLVRHYGEPYADSSAVPTYYVSQITRRSVTVALNGDGGDESFAGYERYLASRLATRARGIPGSRGASRALARLLPASAHSKSRVRQARRFLEAIDSPPASSYARWVGASMGAFTPEEKLRLCRPELLHEARDRDPRGIIGRLFRCAENLDPVDAAMSVDAASYLPYDLLVKVDITSMANSLEARSPFLDHEVMEFAASLPVELKLKGRTSKYLVRRAFPDLLPVENVQRRKMGFGVPVSDWLRGPMRDLLADTLLGHSADSAGYFQPAEVRRLVSEHMGSRADHGYRLWNLLMLDLWRREVLQARPPVAAADAVAAAR